MSPSGFFPESKGTEGSFPQPLPPIAPNQLLNRLLSSNIVPSDDWHELSEEKRDSIQSSGDSVILLRSLREHRLLTEFQEERIRARQWNGLIVGNYRILDRLGRGGMGVVFRGEHIRLRKQVAIKVLVCDPTTDPRQVRRFYAETRAVGQLRHPHTVSAIDAGEIPPGLDGSSIHYFVMEYLAGRDLDTLISEQGPLQTSEACQIIHQIADALHEAHQHGLIHRDIKPSNILVTPEGNAKLLDFGLARLIKGERLTEAGVILGTLGYMAPEQAIDPGLAESRSDIFSLGCTLFRALSGHDPFPSTMASRLNPEQRTLPTTIPSIRRFRPDIPAELEAVVRIMMAPNPNDRYPDAQSVMRALLPFVHSDRGPSDNPLDEFARSRPPSRTEIETATRIHEILIVDDDSEIRRLCKLALTSDRTVCEEAAEGEEALELLQRRRFDLVLLDMEMPGMNGTQVLHRIREQSGSTNIKVILFSGHASHDDMSRGLLDGADDFLAKPFSLLHLRARVKTALRFKAAQDRAEMLTKQLLSGKTELEKALTTRDGDLIKARNALVLALAQLVEQRSSGTGAHLMRIQRFCRILAEAAAKMPMFAAEIDDAFVNTLEDCAPLHDIGKVALPDHILLKPGKLEGEERMLMQAHTTIGAETLREVARNGAFNAGFLQMAVDIARHHHERWDGTGYPDRLAGTDIPLSARILAIADVYDALRSRRVYKPTLSHYMAVLAIREASPGHFDPSLLLAFERCAPQFEQVFREISG